MMEKENLFFEINSQGNFVKIETLGLINYSSNLDYDNNYIKCNIYVSGGAFSGSYNADILTVEFEEFKHELNSLYNNFNGTAEFSNLEGEINIKIKGDGIGHFNARIECIDFPGINSSELIFEIEFDQTFIKKIVSQINQITKEFPIKGSFNIKNNYNL